MTEMSEEEMREVNGGNILRQFGIGLKGMLPSNLCNDK